MIKTFFTTVLFVSLSCCGQNSPAKSIGLTAKQDSIAYLQKCVEFIKQLSQQEIYDTNFILADKPFSFEYFECIEELLADTGLYTKEELSFIKGKKFPSISKWAEELFRNVKLVSNDTIEAIFKDRSKGWAYYYKHFGHGFSTFSVPIFLRNDSYCLFYSDYHCGGLCGRGTLTLYRKENNKWVGVKSYCNWIS
jgi:hypothetical protein